MKVGFGFGLTRDGNGKPVDDYASQYAQERQQAAQKSVNLGLDLCLELLEAMADQLESIHQEILAIKNKVGDK